MLFLFSAKWKYRCIIDGIEKLYCVAQVRLLSLGTIVTLKGESHYSSYMILGEFFNFDVYNGIDMDYGMAG